MTLLIIFMTGLQPVQSEQQQQSAEAELRSILKERDREIKELVGPEGTEHSSEQRQRLQEIINDMIDYRAMAEYALGDHYQQISSEKREKFVSLFSKIVRDQSMNRLEIYRAKVSYQEIEVSGDEACVETTVALDNVRIPVHYTLVRDDDSWHITDMIIDDVSTAGSYRRQFQGVIRQRGFDALMESLERRAERIAQS